MDTRDIPNPGQDTKEQIICHKIFSLVRDELYLDFRYLDRALASLPPREMSTLTVQATDGAFLFYSCDQILRIFRTNPVFLNRAVLHSVFHCIFRHLWLRNHRDILLWNLACDITVEYIIDSLEKKSVRRILSGIRTSLYRELDQMQERGEPLTAALLYEKLIPEEKDKITRLHREFYVDDHRFWPKEDTKSPSALQAEKNWEKIGRQTEQEVSLRKGRDSEGSQSLITQIHAAKSRPSYADFLKQFTVLKEELHADYDEFDLGYYSYGLRLYRNLPLIEHPESREALKIAEFVIVIDTSFSTSGSLVKRFLQRTFEILMDRSHFFNDSVVRILQCDDAVRKDSIITCAEDIEPFFRSFELTGGGGTDFRPAFSYVLNLLDKGVLKDLRGLLYFTDGKGIYPSSPPPYKTAFIFTGEDDDRQVPPWAIRIELGGEDLSESPHL